MLSLLRQFDDSIFIWLVVLAMGAVLGAALIGFAWGLVEPAGLAESVQDVPL
ncbi:hypothetical protein [Chitinimonas sp. BJB300]|uniref:hypothetical protein n=1 Tax=Chitinimonas sp. BJB300 TaxID=1559339 RepID=UPI001304786B|nr:hypothetical protein [Chitinimonas sp. BJB300]